MATRAWRISAFAVDIASFMARMFALLAIFIWAIEFVIEPRMSSSLRAAEAPWQPAVLAVGLLSRWTL